MWPAHGIALHGAARPHLRGRPDLSLRREPPRAEQPLYQALNLTGALGVAWVCWRKRTWQAFWLEAIWAGVALIALVRGLLEAA